MKKKLLAGLCALVLAFTFGLGAMSYLPTKTAYAASVQANLAVTLPSEVEYMSEVTVPTDSVFTTVTVTAPNRKAVTLNANKFTADQIGNYVVTYSNGDLSYSFRIYSSIEEEYQLVVNNDYTIPTIVKKGAAVELPAAEVGFYDEDGNWVKDESATYKVEAVTATIAEGVATFADAGSAFLTYVAKVENGTKVLTKTYEVKVQDEFVDEKAPTLSVSNVPSSGNTNMAVTLPRATATDTYDENVQVKVTVKKNGVDVKKATVDKNGIGSIADDAVDAIFDNNNNMTFYPAEDGDYKVTYQAIDDATNKSAEWTYTITVSDKKAPVMTIDNSIIPAKWGYAEVTKVNDEAVDATLKFPVPEFYDNKDKAEDVVVEFTLKDPEGKTVVKFDNINATEAPKYTNANIDGELTYVKDGNTFTVGGLDLADYVAAVKTADYQAEGDYTITYSAKDARGNKSTKSYTVNLTEDFADSEEVSATFKSYEKNIVLKGDKTEYTVPTAVCNSAIDSNLTITYTANGVKVNAGEVISIVKNGTGYDLVTEAETVAFDATAGLTFAVTAVSDAGNTATASAIVTVVTPDTYTYDIMGSVDATGLTADSAKHEIDATIVVTNVVKHAVGVELGIMNADGEYLTSFEAEVFTVTESGVTGYAIRNIAFAGGAGDYYLVVSAYDIAGGRKTSINKITVGAATDNDDVIVVPTAALNVDSADANAAINFANVDGIKISKSEMAAAGFNYDANVHTLAVARVIKGGKFAIIGDTMTAMNEGAYTVTEKLVVLEDGVDAVVGAQMQALLDSKKTSSTVAVSDSDAVKLEVQGEAMPSYSALNATVTVPTVAAYTTSANAKEIEFKVTAPDGTNVKVAGDGIATPWSFVTAQNGTYTMTFTAKVGNKEDATFTYTLKAGDLIAPVITITGTHAATMTAGEEEFAYLVISATDGENGTELADLTFTKTVYGPNGSVVGTQISGQGSTYANKTAPSTAFTLNESGKYTVKYTVTDAAGNVATKEFEITVTAETGNSGISLAALSTILIVVGVLLIAGVIVYLFRFRKVDKSKKN